MTKDNNKKDDKKSPKSNKIINKEEKEKKKKINKEKKQKEKINKRKFITFLKWFFLIILIAGIIGGGIGAIMAYNWIQDAPELDMNRFEYMQSSYIVDKNGDFYQELQGTEKREVVGIDEIPEMVKNAFISIEDERFYDHKGIDIQGITRAVFEVATTGSLSGPGGSTITQQLLKLTHLSNEKKLKRKIIEMYLALELERQLTKDQILEAYLNKINFAYAHGVQAASEVYFRKDVKELSVAQAAVLASIIKSPTYYKPYVIEEKEDGTFGIKYDEDGKIHHRENNYHRSLAVIDKMYELGHISKEEYDIAHEQIVNNNFGLLPPAEKQIYSFFTDELYVQIIDDLMESDDFSFDNKSDAQTYLLNSGLKIYSTIDPKVQNVLDTKFADDSLFPKQSSTAKKASEAKSKDTGEEINYTPEGAMVIIDNSNSHVVGMIGGRKKEGSRSLNRATETFQVGSSTKPLTVYAPGLETKTLTLATTFDDTKIKKGSWEPGNAGGYLGMTTVRYGLQKSKNVIAAQAWFKVGLENSVKYADLLGLELIKKGKLNDMNPAALSLGGYTEGQTPLVMASAYSTFPNKGVRTEPIMYTKIEDSEGNIIIENKQEKIRVFSAQTAYLITDVLKNVVRGGTTNISVPGKQIAGKTGTTNEKMHAWFCGYTPYYTGAVWYGYDENKVVTSVKTYKLNIGVYGGDRTKYKPGPALMWQEVMREINKDLKNKSLPGNPGGIVTASIDSVSGKLPTELTKKDPRGSTIISEKFIRGTVPSEKDDYHVEVTLDMSTGKIATDYCPESVVETVVRIRKPEDRFPGGFRAMNPNFVPKNELGVLAPAEDDICTVHTPESINALEISTNNAPIETSTIEVGEFININVRGKNHKNQYVDNLANLSITSNNNNVKIEGDKGSYKISGLTPGNSIITATVKYTYKVTVGEKTEDKEYTYTDTLNITVTTPNQPPVIDLETSSITLHVSDTFNEPTVTVTDPEGETLTASKVITKDGTTVSNIDTSAVGTFEITYTATDSKGLSDSKVLTVNVVNDAPVVNIPNDITIVAGTIPNITRNFILNGISITDTEDGTINPNSSSISPENYGSIDTNPSEAQEYSFTISITDSLGNIGTAIRKLLITLPS